MYYSPCISHPEIGAVGKPITDFGDCERGADPASTVNPNKPNAESREQGRSQSRS